MSTPEERDSGSEGGAGYLQRMSRVGVRNRRPARANLIVEDRPRTGGKGRPMRVIELGKDVWGDERGWGMNPWRDSGLLPDGELSCHVVSLEPGAVRGNHRHPDAEEWLVLFGAPATVAVSKDGGPVEEVRVEGDRPVMIHVEVDEAHALRGEGPGTSFLVAFNDCPAPTTVRVPPLLDSRMEEGRGTG